MADLVGWITRRSPFFDIFSGNMPTPRAPLPNQKKNRSFIENFPLKKSITYTLYPLRFLCSLFSWFDFD